MRRCGVCPDCIQGGPCREPMADDDEASPLAKKARTVAALGWLKYLPENGSDVRGAADSEKNKLWQREEMLRAIDALDKEIMILRGIALAKVRNHWTHREIEDAKRQHKADVAAGNRWA